MSPRRRRADPRLASRWLVLPWSMVTTTSVLAWMMSSASHTTPKRLRDRGNGTRLPSMDIGWAGDRSERDDVLRPERFVGRPHAGDPIDAVGARVAAIVDDEQNEVAILGAAQFVGLD